jgi:hypothetical protein
VITVFVGANTNKDEANRLLFLFLMLAMKPLLVFAPTGTFTPTGDLSIK